MKLVIFSDTHGSHEDLTVPDGDILIFAGDMCGCSNKKEVRFFKDWLIKLPHKYKIIIAGNHDWPLYNYKGFGHKIFNNDGLYYLQDSWVIIKGIFIYGSPWQPEFCNWAFNLPR